MLWAASALIIIGLVFLFVLPWVGIPAGILGLLLLLVYVVGLVRRPARR